MKRTVTATIGNTNFTFYEDAYRRLDLYLNGYRAKLGSMTSAESIMNGIEENVATALLRESAGLQAIVTIAMVEKAASECGLADNGRYACNADYREAHYSGQRHKFYRNPDKKAIAGVCSGIAEYADADLTLIRIIALCLLLCFSCGFWIYLICWIVAPVAKTPAEKCELRGLEPTPENMARFA